MKKIRMEKNISEDIIEIDQMLLTALKRNLGVAKRLSVGVQDENQKEALGRFLNRHVLLAKERPVEKVVPELTEGEKKLHKISRYLGELTEGDFVNLLVLVKSMHQRQKQLVPASGPSEPKGIKKKSRVSPGVKSENSQGEPISGASSASVSD